MAINLVDNRINPLLLSQEEETFPSNRDYSNFGHLLERFPNMPQEPRLYTPFEIAAALGYLPLCEEYYEQGMSPASLGAAGFSPLALAFMFNRKEIFSYLFESQRELPKSTFLIQFKNIALNSDDKHLDSKIPENAPIGLQHWLRLATFFSPSIGLYLFDQADVNDQVNALSWAFSANPTLAEQFWERAKPKTKRSRDLPSFYYWVRASSHYCPALTTKIFATATPEEQVHLLDQLLVKSRNEELFMKLFEEASPFVQGSPAESGEHYLHTAILFNRTKCAAYLLEKATDVQFVNQRGWSPLHVAIDNPKTDLSIISTLQERDGDFSYGLDRLRLLGHRFELAGPLFEGTLTESQWNLPLTTISHALSKMMGNNPRLFPAQIFLPVYQGLEAPYFTVENHVRLASEKFTLIPAGHRDHAIYYIFSKEFFAKIDTGIGKRRGIKFYQIRNFDPELIKTHITALKEAKKKSREELKELLKQIKQELSLNLVSLEYFSQRVGNCNWQGCMVGLLGLMVFSYAQNIDASNKLTMKEKLSRALEMAMGRFNFLKESDLEDAIEDLSLMGNYPGYFDEKAVIAGIIHYCLYHNFARPLDKLITLYPQLIGWSDPQTGKSLIQLAYHYRCISFFASLIGVDSNLNHKDNEGRTLLDDMEQNPPTAKDKDWAKVVIETIDDRMKREGLQALMGLESGD